MSEQGKTFTVGIPKETYPGERRVALIPDTISSLNKAGITVVIQAGAGLEAGYVDKAYQDKGAMVVSDRAQVFQSADLILQVRGLGTNPEAGQADLPLFKPGQVLVASLDPLSEPKYAQQLAETKVKSFALELIPRITRAQSMDILSSMASIAGYKAVLLAAEKLPKMFPMMMTAAGTISPAKVFVIGAGVAGLQAIATAKRLGALVHGYDVRPAVKEQVESLGGKFIELNLDTGDAEDKGGYAKALDEDFYRKQREMMLRVVAENDVVITTAAIPGKKAPILITREMVEGMAPGSVIVDLAAERGGNCELTQPDQVIVENGVTIIGTLNLPSTVAFHASRMFAKNCATFLLSMIKDGVLTIDKEDEIIKETLVTEDGNVVLDRVRELLQ
jgi:H+-translocating NAD(P) transhydrogenase subunit alpha